MAEIVDITDRSPNPALVEMLEHQLERARRGELRSCVMILAAADNATGYGFSMDPRTWQTPIIGELEYVRHVMIERQRQLRESQS